MQRRRACQPRPVFPDEFPSMGWSRTGVDKMAHLMAYYWNGGNMLELVRQQERELPVAAGAENEVLSCESMLRWER